MPYPRPTFLRRSALAALLAATAMTFGCAQKESAEHAPRGAAPDQIPAAVMVPGGPLVSGTAVGTMRRSYDVAPFRIAKSPTRVAEYRACVAAGACKIPASRAEECRTPGPRHFLDRASYDVEGGDALPVTCVTAEQAAGYCAWVGGALPTMTEWQLAARGGAPAPFSWGTAAATCDVHPATNAVGESAPCATDGNLTAAFAVGKHPAGASPFGVEDVLLTRGEILAASDDAQFSACAAPHVACIVHGVVTGGIDAFAPVTRSAAEDGDGASEVTAGFRCVWRGSK
jgi:formylglycine-generating enzyme required for sulfatase activity